MINEVMYNPKGSDTNKEFIEIYHSQWQNLTNFYISDGKANETLIPININKSSSYSLIIEDDSTLILPDTTTYITDSTIGSRGLNNDETVYLFDDNLNLLDSVKINSSIANNNGYSMEYFNESFYQSTNINGTPGHKNSVSQINNNPPKETNNIILKAYLDETIYLDQKYTKLFKIEIKNKKPCSNKENITVSYSITHNNLIKESQFTREIGCTGYASTGEFIPKSAGNYTLCGSIINSSSPKSTFQTSPACMDFEAINIYSIPCNLSINISTEKFIYDEEEKISFYNNLNKKTYPFIIEYWIQDLFGNIVKKKFNTTNTNKKSYTPKIDESDKVLLIKSKLYPLCDDQNLSDNSAEKLIIIKTILSSTYNIQKDSVININRFLGLSDNKAKFGQTLRVKADIYKGNSRKNVVQAWIEKNNDEQLSEKSKINLYSRYTNYSITIPVQIDPNCGYEFEDGDYNLIIEGIDAKATKKINIDGLSSDYCTTEVIYKYIEQDGNSGNTDDEFKLIDFPEEIKENDDLNFKLKLTNKYNSPHNFSVWSYVYRGSKSYSGNRESNKQKIKLAPKESKTISLNNQLPNTPPGDYKLKIKINKDNQKTNKEITKEIKITPHKKEETTQPLLNKREEIKNSLSPTLTALSPQKTEILTIYESPNTKLKKLIPSLFIALLIFLNIILIVKNHPPQMGGMLVA
jgi:hypothetical protein